MSYFGDVELAQACSLGEIVLAHHRSRSCLDPHDHLAPYLSVCLDGGYFEQFDGGVDEVCRGDLFVHPAQESHGNDIGGGGATILNFQVSASLQRLYGVEAAHGGRRRVRCSEAVLTRLQALLSQSTTRPAASEFLGAAEILLPELAASSDTRRIGDLRLKAAVAAAEASPEAPWTLADLACIAGYHRVYFAQKFKLEFGCPPGEYLRRLRVRQSLRLMCIEGLTATEAAHSSGFFDSAHMTNTFRKVTGLTPSLLRRQAVLAHTNPVQAE
jgi:AraC family transcriptional regulator